LSTDGFDFALAFILRLEGGLVDNPKDPGGRTNRGVTQRVYNAWRASMGLDPRDVALIDDSEVRTIYWNGYWQQSHCNPLVQLLDLLQLDTAINMGITGAICLLQAAAGCTIDGRFGPETERAVASKDYQQLIREYCDYREQRYYEIVATKPDLDTFLQGWLNRLQIVRHEIGIAGVEVFGTTDPATWGPSAKTPDYQQGLSFSQEN
jgi:lysozyme family protein